MKKLFRCLHLRLVLCTVAVCGVVTGVSFAAILLTPPGSAEVTDQTFCEQNLPDLCLDDDCSLCRAEIQRMTEWYEHLRQPDETLMDVLNRTRPELSI